MKHVIEHPLDVETAHKVADRAFGEYKAKYPAYDPKLTWTGERDANIAFSAKGVHIAGKLKVREGAIDVDLEVPFLLRVFQSKAIDVIDREVRRWVERAKAGEL